MFIRENRFAVLLAAVGLLLLGYPYLQDDATGAFLGGVTSLVVLVAAVAAVSRRTFFRIALTLGVVTAAVSIWSMTQGHRGNPAVELCFAVFHSVVTMFLVIEAFRTRDLRQDALFGIVAAYLMIGVAFGSIYDFLESVAPGSFQVNVEGIEGPLRWRQLLFFSFMTLTSVGFGDITPTTPQAESLVLVEASIGVLYVAILIARIVSERSSGTSD